MAEGNLLIKLDLSHSLLELIKPTLGSGPINVVPQCLALIIEKLLKTLTPMDSQMFGKFTIGS